MKLTERGESVRNMNNIMRRITEEIAVDSDRLYTGGFLKKRYNFSQISNCILDDENVPIDTKGLYSIIQRWITYYENGHISKEFIRKKCNVGINKFDRMWDELKKLGYLKQYRIASGKNRFIYVYDLLDDPDLSNTETINISLNVFKQIAQ